MIATHIATHIDTAVSPATLWAVLGDVERWPEWLPTIDAVIAERPGEQAVVGAAYLLRQPKLPRARWVVTDWRPGAGFTWRAAGPDITTTASHEVTPLPDGRTRVALAIDWRGPMAWVPRLLYHSLTQRYLDTEARALAERAAA